MQPKTEEFLYFLLWTADQLMNPTFRNVTSSFESWAYRNGLHRQIAELERQKFLERKKGTRDTGVVRLTAQGRLKALGGRDPIAEWNRPWDGQWRLIIFDLPSRDHALRSRLRRYLRQRGFGYLQNSVWITPHPPEEEIRTCRGAKIDVESFLLMNARPCGGESDAQIVEGAWDFDRINELYSKHLDILKKKPSGKLASATCANALRSWATRERVAWSQALTRDPLLPKPLLPPSYLGERAWKRRVQVFIKARRDLNGFRGATPP